MTTELAFRGTDAGGWIIVGRSRDLRRMRIRCRLKHNCQVRTSRSIHLLLKSTRIRNLTVRLQRSYSQSGAAPPKKEIFPNGIALSMPYPDGGTTRNLGGGGDVIEQATRYPRHRTEPRPPMVCVKLRKSVLVVFHLFRATELPYFWD